MRCVYNSSRHSPRASTCESADRISMKRNDLANRRDATAKVAFLSVAMASAVFSGWSSPAIAADRIILRNLKVVTGKTVVSFDEDRVRLSDSSSLAWHEIEKARIAESQQAAFDKMLAALGNDLYRIRQRLTVGDYAGLLPHAKALAERYATRTSDSAYMVQQALMWGQLATGNREQAVVAYLRCYSILRTRGVTKIDLPGERELKFDPKTALTPELVPVWFDQESAKDALPKVYKTLRAMKARPGGTYVYLGTLALAAGSEKTASSVLGALRSDVPTIREFKRIIEAQREVLAGESGPAVKGLTNDWMNFTESTGPLALYWVGRDMLRSDDPETRQQGLLYLLRLPALHGASQPDLAAAALYEAMQALEATKDVSGSVTVRRELLAEYGNSYHARLVSQTESSNP